MLKVDAKTRGHKGFSSLGKDGLLRMVGGVGSIYLSQTSESKRYHEVLRLMESEESARNAQRCTAERELERQRQAERARQVAEEDQREMKRVAVLHTKKSTIHPCPLAPTMDLQNPDARGGWLHTCLWGNVRANVETCEFCQGSFKKLVVCIWSCAQYDFDVCANCYEIAALPEAQRAQKRTKLGQKRKEEEDAESESAAAEELQRQQLLHEQEARKEYECLAKIGKFKPEHRETPAANRKPWKKGFNVYHTRGSHWNKGPLDFDSSWVKTADANARAKFLFYVENCWGLSVEEMFERDHVDEPEVEMKSGMVQFSVVTGEDSYWKVSVVPCSALEHL